MNPSKPRSASAYCAERQQPSIQGQLRSDSFRLRRHHEKTQQAIDLLTELYPGRSWALKAIHQLRSAEREMIVMAMVVSQRDG